MNSEINQTSQPHVLILKFIDKLDLRRGEKGIVLCMEKYSKNNKFKITTSKQNVKF